MVVTLADISDIVFRRPFGPVEVVAFGQIGLGLGGIHVNDGS